MKTETDEAYELLKLYNNPMISMIEYCMRILTITSTDYQCLTSNVDIMLLLSSLVMYTFNVLKKLSHDK